MEAGYPAVISGWGITDESNTNAERILRHAEVSIVDRSVCQSIYSQINPVTSGMICAGVNTDGSKGACEVSCFVKMQCKILINECVFSAILVDHWWLILTSWLELFHGVMDVQHLVIQAYIRTCKRTWIGSQKNRHKLFSNKNYKCDQIYLIKHITMFTSKVKHISLI